MVRQPEDVHEVFLGEQGLLAGAKAGTILVDMTTSKPSMAEGLKNMGTHNLYKVFERMNSH